MWLVSVRVFVPPSPIAVRLRRIDVSASGAITKIPRIVGRPAADVDEEHGEHNLLVSWITREFSNRGCIRSSDEVGERESIRSPETNGSKTDGERAGVRI